MHVTYDMHSLRVGRSTERQSSLYSLGVTILERQREYPWQRLEADGNRNVWFPESYVHSSLVEEGEKDIILMHRSGYL